jgi:hypothetical protein
MTTTVYDKTNKLLTSDSRWSYDRDFGVLYVDDIGFDKIEAAPGMHGIGYAFLFAGNSGVIQQWKSYIRSNPAPGVASPACVGIALLVVVVGTGEIVFEYGQDILLPDSIQPTISFAGSGSIHAAQCWESNKCARKAVDSAMSLDVFSGGEIKYFELLSSKNNLNAQIDLSDMSKAFIEKGMVMFKPNSQTPVPVKEAAANDARVKDLCDKIASGQVTLNAPCDAMFNRPTPEDEDRLKAAMARVFG